MGTRSNIIQKLNETTYRSVYCHWDGYLDHHGRILLDNYKNVEKVSKLLELGSLSSLKEEISPPDGVLHSYENQQKDVTVAYHRDRGEEWKETSYTEKEKLADLMDQFYCYLYFNDDWYITMEMVNDFIEARSNITSSSINNVIEIEGIEWVLLNDLDEFL
jgi:hypothetical protein